jgi:ribosomal protein S18 acetylase RimI-like enzyme
MSADELLERPPWSALTTTHAGCALGNDLARRYPSDVAPMAAIREISDACLQALTALMNPGGVVGLFSAQPVSDGRELAVIDRKVVEQMVYEGNTPKPAAGHYVTLTADDVPEMMRLVELTKPGPFAVRTIALGCYIGIRREDQLVAMAGERMRFDGFTEISAVCTHPGYRKRGYSSLLVGALTRNILQRGETPFLHIYRGNTEAAKLYEQLSFVHRRSIAVTVLKRPA